MWAPDSCVASDQARERTPSTLAARPSLLDREATVLHFSSPFCGETYDFFHIFSDCFSLRTLHKIAIETILGDMTPFGLAEVGIGLLKRQSGLQICPRRGDTCFGQIFGTKIRTPPRHQRVGSVFRQLRFKPKSEICQL